MFCCCYSKTHTPEANTNYISHKQPLSAEGLRNRLHRRELNTYCQKDTEDGTAMKNQLGSWKTPLLQLGYCNEATEQRALTAVTVWSLGIYSTVTAHLCLSGPVWEGWLQMEITHRFLFLSYLRRRGCWPFHHQTEQPSQKWGGNNPYSTEEHVEEQLKPIPDLCLLWVRDNTFSLQQLSEPRAHYSAPSQSQFMLHMLLQHWEKTGSKRSRWNKAFLYR